MKLTGDFRDIFETSLPEVEVAVIVALVVATWDFFLTEDARVVQGVSATSFPASSPSLSDIWWCEGIALENSTASSATASFFCPCPKGWGPLLDADLVLRLAIVVVSFSWTILGAGDSPATCCRNTNKEKVYISYNTHNHPPMATLAERVAGTLASKHTTKRHEPAPAMPQTQIHTRQDALPNEANERGWEWNGREKERSRKMESLRNEHDQTHR
jgi:hypothetical protein